MGKPRPATPEEIELIKAEAKKQDVDLNEKCEFRMSGGKNLIASLHGVDLFILSQKEKKEIKTNQKKDSMRELKRQSIELEESLESDAGNVIAGLVTKIPKYIMLSTNIKGQIENNKAVVFMKVMLVICITPDVSIRTSKTFKYNYQQKWTKESLKKDICDFICVNDKTLEPGPNKMISANFDKKASKYFKTLVEEYMNTQRALHIEPEFTDLLDYKDILKKSFEYKAAESVKVSCKIVQFTLCDEVFVYDIESKKLEMKSIDNVKQRVQLVNKNKSKLQTCIKLAEKLHLNLSFQKNMHLHVSAVFADGSRHDKSFDIILASDIKKWYDGFASVINEQMEKEQAQFTQKYSKHSFYCNALADAIIDFVEENEQYITESAMIKNFRGLKNTFNGEIHDTKASGKLEYVSEEAISNMLTSLVNANIIRKEMYKGTYGTFYTLKKGINFYIYKNIKYKPESKPFDKFSDYDWIAYMEKIKKKGKEKKLTGEELRQQISLLDHKALICLYPELVSDFLQHKPESWIDYIEMMRDMETGKEKKFWKYVLQLKNPA